MPHQTSRTQAIAIAGATSLPIAGALVVRSGETAGWWLVAACVGAAAIVFVTPMLSTASMPLR